MTSAPPEPDSLTDPGQTGLGQRIRSAVIWRSGSQIAAQILAWASTFLVIRILNPEAYGIYAMTQVMLLLFSMINGYGLASAVIQQPNVTQQQLRQVFGLLILVNGALAILQIALSPLAAAYYRTPQVAPILCVQALLYLTIPFSALAYARLSRELEFRRQAQVNMVSSIIGALTAITGALAGWGVWALVWPPIIMFTLRAIGLTIVSRTWFLPVFDFRGAGQMLRYGGAVTITALFSFVMTQADVLIAGRLFEAQVLGIYTTALFLTQLFNNKVIPPLNEVAFTAYARMQSDPQQFTAAFTRAARAIMVLCLPFFIGLALISDLLVPVLLGEKWHDVAKLIPYLAIAMPFWTMVTLLQPATDAAGRPRIALGNAIVGAVLMPIAFITGARWGITGIAAAWLVVYPLLFLICAVRSLPAIHVSPLRFASTITPPVMAAIAMAVVVGLTRGIISGAPMIVQLITLIAVGGVVYCGGLWAFARATVIDLMQMARGKPMV